MGKILALYLYVCKRTSEPSTHAAISSVCMAVGVNLDVGIAHDWLVALSIGFGGLGIFVKESKPETVID